MQAIPVQLPPAAQALVVRAAGPQDPVPAVVIEQAHPVGRVVYAPRDAERAPVIELAPPVRPPIDVLAVHQAAAAAQAAADQPQLVYWNGPGRVRNPGVGRGRYPRRPRVDQAAAEQHPPKRRRTGNNITISDRERESVITAYHDLNQDVATISQITQLKPSTVRSILRSFDQRGHGRRLPRGGNHRATIPQAAKDLIIREIEANSQVKLRTIQDKLTTQRDQLQLANIPSLASIQRIIEKHDITSKLVSYVPIVRNTPDVIEKRKEYASWAIRELLVDSTPVFIDEFGCNISMRRRKGRSKRGSPAVVRVDGLRNRNLSVCVAMSPVCGILLCYTRIQAFDGETFAVFLKSLASKLRQERPGHRFVFILDNAKFHSCAEVKALIPVLGFPVRYLPPYSPFLNPIEECFSKWKGLITQDLSSNVPDAPENTEAKYFRLTTAAEKAMNNIRQEDCFNWNIHSKSFWHDCHVGNDINPQ